MHRKLTLADIEIIQELIIGCLRGPKISPVGVTYSLKKDKAWAEEIAQSFGISKVHYVPEEAPAYVVLALPGMVCAGAYIGMATTQIYP